MKFIVALLLLSLSWPRLSAQTTSDENSWFKYCIGVKGRFYSESECNTGRRPKFEALGLALKQDSDILEEKDIAEESQLRSGVYFDYYLKGTGDFKSDHFNDLVNGASEFKLYYDLCVSEIKNDTRIYGDFFENVESLSNRVSGLNPTERFGAEDPCSNSFNWSSNRESYELLLDVIVDDPVPLSYPKGEGDKGLRLHPEQDQLTLIVGDFYQNSNGSPRLQMAVGNDLSKAQWVTIPYINVLPNTTINLTYAQISGGKTSARYKDWLGENLMFRVSKTLMNGKESYGSLVTGVQFDPPGPQFYVREVTRSACESSMVNVFVCLSDARDNWYMKEGNSKFKWTYVVINQGGSDDESFLNTGTCTMEFDRVLESGETQYKLKPRPKEGYVNPFTIEEELVYSLQLQDPSNEGVIYCAREFTVPAKPDLVEVSQQAAAFLLNGSSYNLLSLDKPYAILDIKDTCDLAHLRQPYKIYKGTQREGGPLLLVNGASSTYEDLSVEEKYQVYLLFMEDFNRQFYHGTMPVSRLSPFGRYFESRFAIWRAQQSGPAEYKGDYTEPPRSYSLPSISKEIKLLSSNKLFFVFGDMADQSFDAINFSFPIGKTGFGGYGSSTTKDSHVFAVDDDGNVYDVFDGAKRSVKVNKIADVFVVDYNADVLITRDPSSTASTAPFYWTKISSDGKVSKTKIADAGKNIKLTSDGKFCFYTSMDGTILYVFNGTNTTTLNSAYQIAEIVGVDVKNKLCLFRSGGIVYSQIYDMNHYYNDFFHLSYFRSWRNDFQNDFWKRWIQNNYGHRLLGVTPNVKETYTLVDQDGCDVSFDVEVRIPELPNLDVSISKIPSDRCAANGEAELKYLGGGNLPYFYGQQAFRTPEDVITIDDLGYGENWVDLLNDKGEIAARKLINIELTDGASAYKKDATCYDGADYNGRIELVLTSEFANADNKEFILTNLATREVKRLTVGSSALAGAFDNLAPAEYEIKVEVGGCAVHQESIVIENRLFSVICQADDAETFGGTGALVFNFTHQSGNVSWAGDYPVQLSTVSVPNFSFSDVLPDVYDGIIAVHTDDYNRTCEYPVPQVTVQAPMFSVEVTLNAIKEEGEASVNLSCVFTQVNELASDEASVLLYKDGVLFHQREVDLRENEFGFSNLSIDDGAYKVVFSCVKGAIDLAEFSLPLPEVSYRSELTPAACPNGSNVLVLSELSGGFGSGSYLLSIDGSTFSEQNSWSFSGSNAKVYVRTSEVATLQVHNSEVAFSKEYTHIVDEALNYPERVSAEVSDFDVSCFGRNDGHISIMNASNGSGSYEWRLGNSDVRKDTFETFGSLSPGAYEVYLRDSGNECPEVKIGTANITEPPVLEVVAKGSIVPICADGTGSVSLRIDGGNEFYKYQLLVDNDSIVAQFPSAGQLDEDSGEEVLFTADSTYEVSGLTAGLYSVLVQDVAGCELTESFELPSYQNPTVGLVKVEPVKCFSDANGFIELDGVSGSGVLDSLFLSADDGSRMDTLSWPNARFDGLEAGGYSLYLKDKNGCLSDHISREVLQPERLEIHKDTIVPVVYTGAGTGKIMVHVSGGNNPAFMHARLLEFNAEDGEEVNIVAEREGRITGFEGLGGGTYTLEVQDVKGCLASMSPIKVDEREDALRLEQRVVTDALCNAGVGSLSVEASGGWGGYTYRVLGQGGASKVPTFESLYAGTYLVMVEDSLGAVDSVRVTINEPGLLQARLIDEVLPTCEDNGALTFEVSGGVGPYQMFDEDRMALAGSDSEAFTAPELGVGDYRFTALDANGCRTDFTGSLNGENLLDVSLVAVYFVSSPGAENGSLRALVKGGVAPYVYRWTNLFEPDLALGAVGDELNDVGSGYYRIRVSEENGCEKSATLLLPDFNDVFLVVDTIGHERSLGASNGFVRLLAQQSRLDSVHVFFPDDSVVRLYGAADGLHEGVLAINGLGGGTYAVVAYGPAGREVVDFEVIAYEPFVFGRVDVSHVSKLGGSDGSMVVSVQGGAPDFTFGWETLDGDSVPVPNGVLGNEGRISGLAAGTYRVRVRDRYDNEINREVEVDEPQSELELVITDSANQSCFNYTDAWVTIEAQGGWGNYHYRHASEPEFLKSFRWSNLPVGEHKFFTMDQKGIVDSVRINITEPDLLRANVALVDSVDCFGGGDGKVYFDVAGGTGPYRYALLEDLPVWSASTGVPATDAGDGLFLFADNLAEGRYVYRFTDDNNCVAADTLSVYVPQPDELLFGVVDVVHTTCDTDNGSIEVLMQGGSAPYRYEWTDNSGTVFSSGSSVDGLEQGGHYSLRVWDKNNCTTGLEQTVNASTLPQILQVVTTPVLCFGDSNGKAAVTGVTPAEPFAPYGFEWSNSAEGDSVDGFSSGRHWVTVRDSNGCETTRYFDVASPDTLGLSLVELRDAHCFGYSDGRIEIRPFGGVGDYRFLWSNGADTPAAENLSKGLYTLSFTDANNCLFEESFEINEPPKEVVDVGEDLSMCPGNSIVIDGRDFTAHRWTKGEELLSEERYFMVAAEGEYALRVTNDRGCYAYDTLSVSIGNDALQADFLMTSEAVLGDTLMLFELSNLPLDSLSWAYPDAAFSKELAGEVDDYVLHLKTLDEGMYNVTLYAYSGGCFSRKVKQVEIMVDGDVDPEDELLGYQDPLIKRFGVSPNPNDGRFNVDVELREAADIHLAVFGVSMGQKLAERRSSGMETYAESFVLANANTGVYVVVLSAGKERRQVKIVIE